MANSGSGSIRFSDEQLFILEEVFEECEDPSVDQIRQMKRTFPLLGTLEDNQLEVWFHNRRTFKRLLTANTRLMAENYVLKNRVEEMESQNELMRQLIDFLNLV